MGGVAGKLKWGGLCPPPTFEKVDAGGHCPPAFLLVGEGSAHPHSNNTMPVEEGSAHPPFVYDVTSHTISHGSHGSQVDLPCRLFFVEYSSEED